MLTCIDNLLYPTSCGPENCDEPIDECGEECDGYDPCKWVDEWTKINKHIKYCLKYKSLQ